LALGVSAFSFPVFCLAWRESDAGTKIWLVTTRGASCVSSHGFFSFLAWDNFVSYSDISWSNDLSIYFDFSFFRSLIRNFSFSLLSSNL